MSQVLLRPNFDAGPNQGLPIPVGAHWSVVDEDPHNGDTDRISSSGPSTLEVFGIDVSGLADGALIGKVTLRSTGNSGGGDSSYRVGFRIGGLDYFAAVHSKSAGDPYVVEEDVFATNPATGALWTKAALAGAFFVHQHVDIDAEALPRPRLTQFVGIAEIADLPRSAGAASTPGRSSGTPSTRASSSGAASPSGSGSGAASTPGRLEGAVSTPAAAAGTASAPAASSSSRSAPAASAALPSRSGALLAALSTPGRSVATPASLAPTATVAVKSPLSWEPR
jgi:hypothetical protein